MFRLNDAHWSVVTSDFTMTHKNYNSFNKLKGKTSISNLRSFLVDEREPLILGNGPEFAAGSHPAARFEFVQTLHPFQSWARDNV